MPCPRARQPQGSALLILYTVSLGCASAQSGGSFTEQDMARPEEPATGLDLQQAQDLRPPSDDLAMTLADLRQPPDLRPITGCQLVPQAGCPVGQKCTTHDAETTICDPVGRSQRGQPCTTMSEVDSCVAGSVCIDEGAGQSQCRAFCNTDADCGHVRSYCMYSLGGMAGFRVCSQPCNAIFPGAGCASGLACVAVNFDLFLNQERTDCQAPGPRDAGQPCNNSRDCKGGMACIGPAGAGICYRLCPKGNNAFCGAGGTCSAIVSGGLFEWPNYGACI